MLEGFQTSFRLSLNHAKKLTQRLAAVNRGRIRQTECAYITTEYGEIKAVYRGMFGTARASAIQASRFPAPRHKATLFVRFDRAFGHL
jgi:hypothetical protein